MIAFVAGAALLSALAISLLVPALWKAGATRRFALGAPAWVLLAAVLLYIGIGTPAGLQAPILATSQAESMVLRLAQHLTTDPYNEKGWLLLARSQTVLEHYKEAGQAYAQLIALGQDDPQVLVAYADVLAVAQGKSFQGEPERLLERALATEPHHPRALFLAGGASFERGEFDRAIVKWALLATLLSEDDELYGTTVANLADARSRLAGK